MEKLSDAMNLVFIELGRFKKSIGELENDKERFYFCLKHMARFKQMPSEFEGNRVMEALFRTTAVESLSKEDKIKYVHFMTTERDIRNQRAFALEQAMAEGMAKGISKGKAEGKAEDARNFLAKGVDIQIISECTGLSVEQIKAL